MLETLWGQFLAFLRDTAVPIALTLIVALILWRLTRPAVSRVFQAARDVDLPYAGDDAVTAQEVGKRIATVESLAMWLLRGLIVVIVGLVVFSELGVNVGPALAGVGIAGIAIGFGAQSLVRDYFNGTLILLENQFAKGDRVTIAGVTGIVEDFSLRRTTVRDIDGVLHTVPNGEITVASNRTRTWARINLDVTVAHGTNVDRAVSVVNQACEDLAASDEWHDEVLEIPVVGRVEAIGELGITLKVLGKVRPTAQPMISGELRRRLLEAFAANGIMLPRQQVFVAAPMAVATGPGPTEEELSSGSD